MVKLKPEIGLILIVTLGVLVLSAASFWNARGKLRRFEAAADRQAALLDAAVTRQFTLAAALRTANLGKLDSRDGTHDALKAAGDLAAAATGMTARAAAYARCRDAATACLALADARPDLGLDLAPAKALLAADPELQKLAADYNLAAKAYNIQIRKNPDTRLTEGLKLKPRDFFGAPP